jgi:hypothetical protein
MQLLISIVAMIASHRKLTKQMRPTDLISFITSEGRS